MHLSDTIQRLAESATLAMARKSRELKERGIDVISLSLGEPDFHTPDFVKEAAIGAINGNYSKYTPVNGYLDVRKAISTKFKRDNGLDYTPDQIVLSTGAKQSIANVVLALVSPGEEVILPAPYWVSYEEIVKLANGTPIKVLADIQKDFKISPEQLEESITDKTRLVIFSSPCNPTGSVYSRDELEGLAKVLVKYPGVYVISDEIYEHIRFEGSHASLASIPEIYDRVITVNGVSKAWAMTGWRLGYIGAPLWIAKACSKIQGQVTSGPSGISQKAAQAAVTAAPKETRMMVQEFHRRRDYLIDRMSAVEGLVINRPEGAFYIFPDVSAFLGRKAGDHVIASAGDLCEYLLEHHHIAFVAGEAFGAPGHLRISYAASMEELEKAMDRFIAGLAALD